MDKEHLVPAGSLSVSAHRGYSIVTSEDAHQYGYVDKSNETAPGSGMYFCPHLTIEDACLGIDGHILAIEEGDDVDEQKMNRCPVCCRMALTPAGNPATAGVCTACEANLGSVNVLVVRAAQSAVERLSEAMELAKGLEYKDPSLCRIKVAELIRTLLVGLRLGVEPEQPVVAKSSDRFLRLRYSPGSMTDGAIRQLKRSIWELLQAAEPDRRPLIQEEPAPADPVEPKLVKHELASWGELRCCAVRRFVAEPVGEEGLVVNIRCQVCRGTKATMSLQEYKDICAAKASKLPGALIPDAEMPKKKSTAITGADPRYRLSLTVLLEKEGPIPPSLFLKEMARRVDALDAIARADDGADVPLEKEEIADHILDLKAQQHVWHCPMPMCGAAIGARR